jgi:UPF0716 family protein affecting phage T7 exclusion
MIWFLSLFTILVSVYTFLFGRVLIKEEGNKLAGFIIYLIAAINLMLPYFINIK